MSVWVNGSIDDFYLVFGICTCVSFLVHVTTCMDMWHSFDLFLFCDRKVAEVRANIAL